METLEELLWNNFPVGKKIQAYRIFEYIHGMLDDVVSEVFSGIAEDAIISYLNKMHSLGYLTYEKSTLSTVPDYVILHEGVDPSTIDFFGKK